MKKAIIFVVLFLISFAQIGIAKPPIPLMDFAFNGEVAFSPSNPSVMNQFENPVLCDYSETLDPKKITACRYPYMFMAKGGMIKLWTPPWSGGVLSDYEIQGSAVDGKIITMFLKLPKTLIIASTKITKPPSAGFSQRIGG